MKTVDITNASQVVAFWAQVACEANLLLENITRLELDVLVAQAATELRLGFEPMPNSQPIQVTKKLAGFFPRWELRCDGAEEIDRIGESFRGLLGGPEKRGSMLGAGRIANYGRDTMGVDVVGIAGMSCGGQWAGDEREKGKHPARASSIRPR
jgi:hypothetical protein